MDVNALAAGSRTAEPAVIVKETQIAGTENEAATPAIEASVPERAAVHSITTNEDAVTNVNVDDNGMTDNFDDSKPLCVFVCFMFCVFCFDCLVYGCVCTCFVFVVSVLCFLCSCKFCFVLLCFYLVYAALCFLSVFLHCFVFCV